MKSEKIFVFTKEFSAPYSILEDEHLSSDNVTFANESIFEDIATLKKFTLCRIR